MKFPWWVPFGPVPEVLAAELSRTLGRPDPPQLLDVRTALEFAAGHIAGARHLPVTALDRLETVGLDPRRPVVAICLTAHRSVPAVRLLRSRGFAAEQLAGGMRAWRAAGLPEER
jgi:rhodanese-related sulfurtransferase